MTVVSAIFDPLTTAMWFQAVVHLELVFDNPSNSFKQNAFYSFITLNVGLIGWCTYANPPLWNDYLNQMIRNKDQPNEA